LFSTVYALMSHVVFCIQPSVRAAYRAPEADVGPSSIAVYNKLNGLAPPTASELVRYSARELAPLIEPMDGARAPWREGYRINIVDGNCLEAREPRLQDLRQAPGRALPGKAFVVYEPAQGLVTPGLPCEDGQAQERSRLGAVLQSVRQDALWIADRHCCTRAFLTAIDSRGGFFVIREHRGVPWEMISSLRSCGRPPTGPLAEQRVRVVDAQGHTQVFRRLRRKLNHAPRDGDTLLSILPNVPRQGSAPHVAQR
jgi:hypothetical protein